MKKRNGGETVKPDYRGGSIVNLMATVARRFGHRTTYRPLGILPASRLKTYKKIVLMVLDGLGYGFLERQGRGFLSQHLAGRMTSVFPSTTATAVTTFATGTAPLEHGVTGWFTYLRELGSVSKILFSQPRHGGGGYREAGISMADVIRARSVYEKLKARSFIVTPSKIAQGDFAKALAGRATFMGFQSLLGFSSGIKRAIESQDGPLFVSAYWPDLDGLMHQYGVYSREAGEHFLELDAAVGQLCASCSGGEVLFIITSDHGMIDTPSDRLIDVGDHPDLHQCLSMPLCGEPRLAYCYVHPDRADLFRSYVRKHFKKACRLLDRSSLIGGDYFGLGRPHPWFRHRVGDFALAMDPGWTIRDYLPNEDRRKLAAGHGGMSADEMLVPLILAG